MKNEVALTYCEKTIALKKDIEVAFLTLGERLFKIRTEEIWKLGGFSSYEEFLMEARLTTGTASKIETVYEHFILNLKISPEKVAVIGWTDAYLISQIADTKKEAIEWLEKGELLSSGDLRIEIMGVKKGVDQKDCKHHNTYRIEVCRDCGLKTKLLDEE